MKEITIVILVHSQYIPLLGNCLKSLNEQILNSVTAKYIVIFNGADLRGFLSPYLENSKFKFIQTKSMNRAEARNYGAALVEDEFIGFVDAHVEVPADWIETSVKKIEQLDVSLIQPSLDFKETNNYMAKRFKKIHSTHTLNSGHYFFEHSFQKFPTLDTSAIIIKNQVFKDIKGFDNTYDRFEDRNLGIRLINAGYFLHGTTELTVVKNLKLKGNIRQFKDLVTDIYYSVKCALKESGKVDYSLKYLLSTSTYSSIYFIKHRKKMSADTYFQPGYMEESIITMASSLAFAFGFICFFYYKKINNASEINYLTYQDKKFIFLSSFCFWSCDQDFYFKSKDVNYSLPFVVGRALFDSKGQMKVQDKNFFLEKMIVKMKNQNIIEELS